MNMMDIFVNLLEETITTTRLCNILQIYTAEKRIIFR